MIEHGLPITDVASLLGHSKFDTTLQVYAHPVVGGHRRHALFDRMSIALLDGAYTASPMIDVSPSLDAASMMSPASN